MHATVTTPDFAAPTACPPTCTACGLRTTGAFSPATSDQLLFLESFRIGTRPMAAGQQIIPENRLGTQLFTLYDGWAMRYKTLSDGRRQILNFLLPGDFIGLQQELTDNATHGVEALTDVLLCVFPRDRLWEFYQHDPRLGYALTWLSASQERLVDDNLLTNGRRNATERVAMLLVQLYRRAERLGMATDGSIAFPFTQQHIADALGLSLVHTNKTLRRLAQLGLHTIRSGRLHMVDPRGLEHMADYYARPLGNVPLI